MSAMISSRASSASMSASPISIRKKRLACDNCHLSKVRCTGEISGCQRCERGNKTCHYSESNMGRTPADGASRRRKSNTQRPIDSSATGKAGGQQQQRQQHEWSSSTSPFEGTTEQQSDQQNEASYDNSSGEREFDLQYNDRPASDSMSLWDEPTGQPQAQQHQQQSSASILLESINSELQSPSFDPLMSNFDDIDFSDIDDSHFEVVSTPLDLTFPRIIGSQSPRTASPQHLPPQKLLMPQIFGISSSTATSTSRGSASSQASGTPSSSGGPVSFWAIKLEELSRRPQKTPIPLDEMLHHSSQLLPRVMDALRALGSTDAPPSSTQLILILLCLTQTITLFEQCLPSVISGRTTSGSTNDLSLRLGGFQVDRDVQQALQMHMVGRELSTILRASKMIKEAVLLPDWNSVSRRTHCLLLEDLQVRTKTLLYQMKQKWSSARKLAL